MKNFCLIIISFIMIFLSASPLLSQSSKKGIAYGYHYPEDLDAIKHGVSWWYNWYIKPDKQVATVYQNYNIEFYPMAWNGAFNESELRKYLDEHPGVKYILGFNEPNFKSQANMTPRQVAAAWPKVEAVARDYGLKIVGPAVNWCDECLTEDGVTFYDPIDYLDAFYEACKDCKVDFVAVHTYMCHSGALISFIDRFKKYGKPIWVTEFACWDQPNITVQMQKSLVIGALDYLENDPMIYKYSWFNGGRNNAYPFIDLFDKEPGSLTELGELYVNYNAIHNPDLYYPVPSRIEAEAYSTMSGIALEATQDFDGLANVGWIDPGDWLNYHIEVPESADYYIYLRVAGTANTSLSLHENEELLTAIEFPSTGGWQNWKTIVAKVPLTQGKQKLKVYSIGGNFNLNWIRIADRENTPPQLTLNPDKVITLPQNSVVLQGEVTDPDDEDIKFAWIKTNGPSGDVIENPGQSETVVSGLKEGTYVFRLTVFDGFETVSSTVQVKVNKEVITHLHNREKTSLQVYPNPLHEKLTIRYPDQVMAAKVVRIFDQTGKVMQETYHEPGNEILTLDVSTIKKGLYIMHIQTSDTSVSIKLIK